MCSCVNFFEVHNNHNVWKLMGRNQKLWKGFPWLWPSKVGVLLNSQSQVRLLFLILSSQMLSVSLSSPSLFLSFPISLSPPTPHTHTHTHTHTIGNSKDQPNGIQSRRKSLLPLECQTDLDSLPTSTDHWLWDHCKSPPVSEPQNLPWNRHINNSTITWQPNFKIAKGFQQTFL